MSVCQCRLCGPIGSKSTTIEVTVTVAIERPGWEQTGYGEVWSDEVETEHELRAAVTFYGVDDSPEVEWLDAAAVEDLDLTAGELEGAEELAIEAAADVLRKQAEEYEDPRIAKADREYDERRDDEILGEAS